MKLTFDTAVLEVDVERTRAYYETLRGKPVDDFDLLVRNHCAYIEYRCGAGVKKFLESMGIAELAAIRINECWNIDGKMSFDGVYPVFGHIVQSDAGKPNGVLSLLIKPDGTVQIDNSPRQYSIQCGAPELSIFIRDPSAMFYDEDRCRDLPGSVLLVYIEDSEPWLLDEACPFEPIDVIKTREHAQKSEVLRQEIASKLRSCGAIPDVQPADEWLSAFNKMRDAFYSDEARGRSVEREEIKRRNYNYDIAAEHFRQVRPLRVHEIIPCYNELTADGGYFLMLYQHNVCVYARGPLPPLEYLDSLACCGVLLFDEKYTFCFCIAHGTGPDSYYIGYRGGQRPDCGAYTPDRQCGVSSEDALTAMLKISGCTMQKPELSFASVCEYIIRNYVRRHRQSYVFECLGHERQVNRDYLPQLWNYMDNRHMDDVLCGNEAKAAFDACKADKYYIFSTYYPQGLHVTAGKLPTARMISRFRYEDVYVIPDDLSWVYADDHESYGPYFVQAKHGAS